MRELSLFSGIGGGLLGSLLLGWHTVAAVDFEPYACEVLARRKQDGFFKDPFDIYCMDIGEFNRRVAPIYRGKVDIITGGFPCQPFSCAGKRKGSDDSRNGFPVLADTIRIVRPRYIFLENVPALLNFGYFGEILSTLSESGYDVRWKVISASEVGAPHRRERLWIYGEISNTTSYEPYKMQRDTRHESRRDDMWQIREREKKNGRLYEPEHRQGRGIVETSQDLSDTTGEGLERCRQSGQSGSQDIKIADSYIQSRAVWWDFDPADDPESGLDRMAHGLPHRLDRLKGIGNGQVSQCMAAAFRILSQST